MKSAFLILAAGLLLQCSCVTRTKTADPVSYSGVYPHLAYYNNEGECGTGAVVPWAGKLWVITYGPHLPFGSSDKLYEIAPDLHRTIRPESTGGTPANRIIHKESRQLFIGPYAIDTSGNVRVIPYSQMPGRLTGNARHLNDPSGKIYYGTMEEGFSEVDVKTLSVTTLFEDGNVIRKEGQMAQETLMLLGAHGKGLFSGQGVLVYSNNGETGQAALERSDIPAGALYEYDGNEWKLVRRNQFVEVTGPGGIYGNENPDTDPIWVTGWDHKSLIVGVRSKQEGWSFYRLPKASHTYDGAHGWNTEWPRIRDVGTPGKPDYLMTMHGMFWHFPGTFTAANAEGIRPRSAYLKVIGDFARWNGRLVFGCDDSANKEFLNKRKQKGEIEGPGQSNSNLWFTSPEKPDQLGPCTAEGAVWMSEEVKSGVPSEPFLFAGWDIRSAWIKNEGTRPVAFGFEIDKTGNGQWSDLMEVNVGAGESMNIVFGPEERGEWIRVMPYADTRVTVHFSYAANDMRNNEPDAIFAGLSPLASDKSLGGLLWGLGDNRRRLGLLAGIAGKEAFAETGYYELDSLMRLVKKEDPATAAIIRDRFAIPAHVVTTDDASVLVVDDKGRRWRLPKGNTAYAELTDHSLLRICREVATERDLFSCSGTFYELPAENADGFAKIRPVASHSFRIHDYASYRGMLVMTGIDPKAARGNPHIVVSDDGQAAVWAGVIDDLWELGKPAGEGGPWKNTGVRAGEPSDPYLAGFYDDRTLSVSHDSMQPVTFRIEVDPAGNGTWMLYKEIEVKPGEELSYRFPGSFQARWIRFAADKDCQATAWLEYK